MPKIHQGSTEFAEQVSIGASGGSLSHGQASVGVAAVVLRAANPKRISIIIQNVHATNKLFIGASGLTTSNTVQVLPGASLVLDRNNGEIQAVADGASTDVRFLEEINRND